MRTAELDNADTDNPDMDTTHKFGLSVALATPFQTNGELNSAKLIDHAQWCLANGCNSVTVLGSTGEGPSLSRVERTAILSGLEHSGVTGEQLITGIFATDPHSAAEMISEAISYGSTRVLIAPPYYFKAVNDDGIFAWYCAVFDRLSGALPGIILYNLPSQTGVTITPQLVSRLRAQFGSSIIGIKDSSSNLDSTLDFLKTHGDLAILVGDERDLGEAVQQGAQGSICGMANLQPQLMKSIIENATTDPDIEALVNEICRYPLFSAIKSAMSIQHDDASWCCIRPPFIPLSKPEHIELARWYRNRFS